MDTMSDVLAALPTQLHDQTYRSSADFFVPSRAKSFDQSQQTPWRYRLLTPLVGRDPAPSPHEYRELIQALSQGDVLMDEYVNWMFSNSPRLGQDKFDQALHHGIESVHDGTEQ